MRLLSLSLTVAALALGACSGRGPNPPVSPENQIQSKSADEMPATGSSGLGTPGGHEDAGLPLLDAGAPR